MKKITIAGLAILVVTICGCGGGITTQPTGYTLNFSAGAHGTLSGSTSQTVSAGMTAATVTATADTGYYFVKWTGDNGFVTTNTNPLTVVGVSTNQNIVANFAINPSVAVLKLSSLGTLTAGTSLSGISVNVQLPSGVTISTDTSNTVTFGVVTASGVAAGATVTPAVYTPATATTPANLAFVVVSNSQNGFGMGEFATANCVIASGHFPTASDFIIPSGAFLPADLLLQPVSGLTATLSATIN